ncbi:MAG: preprotein translocase subunit SecA [bacterium]
MFNRFFTSIFGSRNDRLVKRMEKTVEQINALEEDYLNISDADIVAKTEEFKQRFQKGESLNDLLPEAFALVREASKRTLGLRHYDVQLIGGMVLHQGKISEMKTGEGKTLVATLPVYLNALSGKSVHVVTVNDYLAQRDAEWMKPVYEKLGLSIGVSVAGMDSVAKRAAYAADITYGTNNEFGFDYLRDNMAFSKEERVQRDLGFAIVDEVDSILIDEARTPLIISGPTDDNPDLYVAINKLVKNLVAQKEEDGPGDFSIEEKNKQIYMTEDGMAKVEQLMQSHHLLKEGESLYDANNLALVHHLNAALRANALYQKDVDYIVSEGEIVIVDEFTGRTLAGRRWSDGLHQAVEAKEGVPIQKENQTLASITFQNYFRLYDTLSGMTGTADTEAYEFQTIYGLEVVVIPTHRGMARIDKPDLVFLTQKEKYNAVVEDIMDCTKRQQPVLVGTTSIEVSEYISKILNKNKIKHEVLNAKQHEREAFIITQAGRPGSVTIATNMAGRGTDIVLGGSLDAELEEAGDKATEQQKESIKLAWKERHQQVLDSGGLHIIGTERHESRRIDNQLRGRSGRQGDPGSSRFYLSLEDNLMRIFASEKVSSLMQKLGMEENEAIEHPWVTKAIENAQRKVESHNFDIRKNLLEFDDVANDQRRVIYAKRKEIMDTEDISESVELIRDEVFGQLFDSFIPPETIDEQWDVSGLETALEGEFGIQLPLAQWLEDDDALDASGLKERYYDGIDSFYAEKEKHTGAEIMRRFEKEVMLYVLDGQWKEHLSNMDYLRKAVYLRGYAQKQPKQEYKREAFEMFTELLIRVDEEVIKLLARVQIKTQDDVDAMDDQRRQSQDIEYKHADASAMPEEQAEVGAAPKAVPFVRGDQKVGRNDPCPCGSGRKYKQCHGKVK